MAAKKPKKTADAASETEAAPSTTDVSPTAATRGREPVPTNIPRPPPPKEKDHPNPLNPSE